MIIRIAHIGVAVKNLEVSKGLFSKLLGNNSPHTEKVEEEKATITFYPVGQSSIELIESYDASGSLSKFIEKRGEGIHHICLEVDDIRKEIGRLKGMGFKFVSDTPSPGGEGCLVAFLHPKSTNGVLVELSQAVEEKRSAAG